MFDPCLFTYFVSALALISDSTESWVEYLAANKTGVLPSLSYVGKFTNAAMPFHKRNFKISDWFFSAAICNQFLPFSFTKVKSTPDYTSCFTRIRSPPTTASHNVLLLLVALLASHSFSISSHFCSTISSYFSSETNYNYFSSETNHNFSSPPSPGIIISPEVILFFLLTFFFNF